MTIVNESGLKQRKAELLAGASQGEAAAKIDAEKAKLETRLRELAVAAVDVQVGDSERARAELMSVETQLAQLAIRRRREQIATLRHDWREWSVKALKVADERLRAVRREIREIEAKVVALKAGAPAKGTPALEKASVELFELLARGRSVESGLYDKRMNPFFVEGAIACQSRSLARVRRIEGELAALGEPIEDAEREGDDGK